MHDMSPAPRRYRLAGADARATGNTTVPVLSASSRLAPAAACFCSPDRGGVHPETHPTLLESSNCIQMCQLPCADLGIYSLSSCRPESRGVTSALLRRTSRQPRGPCQIGRCCFAALRMMGMSVGDVLHVLLVRGVASLDSPRFLWPIPARRRQSANAAFAATAHGRVGTGAATMSATGDERNAC